MFGTDSAGEGGGSVRLVLGAGASEGRGSLRAV